jgi:hypothetical protein
LRLVKPFMVVSTKLSTSCWRDLWAIGGSMVNRILMYKMKQYDIVWYNPQMMMISYDIIHKWWLTVVYSCTSCTMFLRVFHDENSC